MESMIIFISILFIVFGLLQIILFFKIWSMTNDVKQMKNSITTDKNYISYALIGDMGESERIVNESFIELMIKVLDEPYNYNQLQIDSYTKQYIDICKKIGATPIKALSSFEEFKEAYKKYSIK